MNNNNVNNFYEYELLTQRYGLCAECKQPNTSEKWCKECNAKRLQQNFGNWSSGNEYVDKFIQESQLKARSYNELLEWVPYTQLRNIQYFAKGGFSTIYNGIWLDGHIDYWNYEKQDWNRRVYILEEKFHEEANNPKIKNPLESNIEYGRPIVLKCLDYSSNINEDFLDEWKLHLQCQYEVRLNGAFLIPIFGITQDPDTLNYMVITHQAMSSLRNHLSKIKYDPNSVFNMLISISIQLVGIHKLNFVHGDFHSGNILCLLRGFSLIGDFGLCKPVIRSNNIDENTYGVLPYMAPEVLRGEPYTKAADIYSFGIIMWELTSGVPAFHNISHDFQLSLDICKGTRPEIIEGTMPEYVELMKRCWDNDPEKRPTAEVLKNTFNEWFGKYSDIERFPVVGNQVFIITEEPETKCHPNACYTSRKISYSARLNQYLAQDSLSDKIVIADDEIMSENLDEFKV